LIGHCVEQALQARQPDIASLTSCEKSYSPLLVSDHLVAAVESYAPLMAKAPKTFNFFLRQPWLKAGWPLNCCFSVGEESSGRSTMPIWLLLSSFSHG
jgi:hypothetical protein